MCRHAALQDFPINTSGDQRSGFVLRILQWAALARQRRALHELNREQLCDIGVSKQDAIIEAQKFAWNVPENWKN